MFILKIIFMPLLWLIGCFADLCGFDDEDCCCGGVGCCCGSCCDCAEDILPEPDESKKSKSKSKNKSKKKDASEPPHNCTRCGVKLNDGANFCTVCGTAKNARYCTQCGAKLNDGANFCTVCGTAVKKR